MTRTAVLSSRGQFVIPAEIRQAAGINPGDRLLVGYDEVTGQIQVRKKESLPEMAERLSRLVKPGTPPLEDIHGFYNTRPARL
ncbi:MAG: AbrB/MazE/SpoVT family DNA-binding domain-containing protein [Propionibacteriaceae bacterium]|jgi:AbrB family looped-hinge helix DNA binding protein|nr:AbrB/MazE/SpoVT family DNA-binding domain-containing protein [Propionibacteriaceae bacterium]